MGTLKSLLRKADVFTEFLGHPLCSSSASEAGEDHNARTEPGFVGAKL